MKEQELHIPVFTFIFDLHLITLQISLPPALHPPQAVCLVSHWLKIIAETSLYLISKVTNDVISSSANILPHLSSLESAIGSSSVIFYVSLIGSLSEESKRRHSRILSI